jgi:hypothetical protein
MRAMDDFQDMLPEDEALIASGMQTESAPESTSAEKLQRLSRHLFATAPEERPRRREELVELAVARLGLDRAHAEQIYDIAHEIGVDPATAFELIAAGVSVTVHESLGEDTPSIDTGNPQWLTETPAREEAEWEGRVRNTLRRVRSLIEREGSVDAAFRAFVDEPDVEDWTFPAS